MKVEIEKEEYENLKAACRKIIEAHDSLFSQCCSNPIKNTWDKEVDCTLINEANLLATRAMPNAWRELHPEIAELVFRKED